MDKIDKFNEEISDEHQDVMRNMRAMDPDMKIIMCKRMVVDDNLDLLASFLGSELSTMIMGVSTGVESRDCDFDLAYEICDVCCKKIKEQISVVEKQLIK